MHDAQSIANRVQLVRSRNTARDNDYQKVIAIRRGDYEAVAPGLFNTADFDKPLVANLIDTTARDIAEVMAPLPGINCQSASMSSDADRKRSDLRGAIANSYVQNSRLQNQMFGGADRYGTFGFMAYIVEPDFTEQMPTIRIGSTPTAYYQNDFRGRTLEYFEVMQVTCDTLCAKYPHLELESTFYARYGSEYQDRKVEIACYFDMAYRSVVLLEENLMLARVPHLTKRCPVRVVERPQVVENQTRGQFDDVIWVQIARALVQMYTMNAIEQAVNAPIAMPDDVNELELGPFAAIQSKNPQGIGRVNLQIPPGLFPESSALAMEQRTGSRYPEGRSGSIDASIITGQGVQALMGTFDTQVQTFQRLNASALEDVLGICFEMDEATWGGVKKTRYIKDNGAPRKIEYTPAKDIAGNYTVDVNYGAIAGLDPNRGLVFVLQALAGGLIAKSTARKSLPVDLNVDAEEQQIQLEQMNDSIAASIAAIPQALPQMVMAGADPRDIVLQLGELHKLLEKGTSPADAVAKVFAPKEQPQPEASPLEMAQGAGPGAAGLPGAGSGGASDLLMSLAGMTPSGKPNLQSNVSRMTPAVN